MRRGDSSRTLTHRFAAVFRDGTLLVIEVRFPDAQYCHVVAIRQVRYARVLGKAYGRPLLYPTVNSLRNRHFARKQRRAPLKQGKLGLSRNKSRAGRFTVK